jgi:hypothetical protein
LLFLAVVAVEAALIVGGFLFAEARRVGVAEGICKGLACFVALVVLWAGLAAFSEDHGFEVARGELPEVLPDNYGVFSRKQLKNNAASLPPARV